GSVIKVWDVRTSQEVGSLNFDSKPYRMLAVKPVPMAFEAAFSPDGNRLAVTGPDGNLVQVWDVPTGKEILTLRGQGGTKPLWPAVRQTARPPAVAFSPDGQRLAVGPMRGKVQVRDLATGKVLHEFAHKWAVRMLTFSPDGSRLAGALAIPKVQ